MAQTNGKVLFSVSEDVKLVECVSKLPYLFDLTDSLHKNQTVKDNAWKKVSEHLQRSVEDCKKRWRNIKDTYMKRKKKAKRSGATKPKHWALDDKLYFLGKVKYKRQISSTIEEQKSHDEEEISADNIQIYKESPNSPQLDDNVDDISERRTNFTRKRSHIPSDDPCSQPDKKQKYNDKFTRISGDRQSEESSKNRDDEIDLFFKSISMSVKRLRPKLQNEAKLECLKIVIELESRNNPCVVSTPQISPTSLNGFEYSPQESAMSTTIQPKSSDSVTHFFP